MLKQLKQLHHLCLVALMALMLCGVQLAQASALHDHARDTVGHTVDCALCHLPLGDDPGAQNHPGLNFTALGGLCYFSFVPAVPACNPSPYSGRAPPLRFS